jgi:hypothetical protein
MRFCTSRQPCRLSQVQPPPPLRILLDAPLPMKKARIGPLVPGRILGDIFENVLGEFWVEIPMKQVIYNCQKLYGITETEKLLNIAHLTRFLHVCFELRTPQNS